MAAPAKYEAPHVQLGRLMVEARRRGLTFEEWWEEAIRPQRALVMVTTANPPRGAVRWPTDRNDRLSWQDAIRSSKAGWHRAYERKAPTVAEAALMLLAPALEALDEAAERIAAEELGMAQQDALPSAA